MLIENALDIILIRRVPTTSVGGGVPLLVRFPR